LTKLPEVSVNGAIGSSTSLMSRLVLKGLSVTTMSQPVSGTPRVSGPGSQFSSSRLQAAGQHLRGIQAADPGSASTTCAPTVLAASVR
jgi:hypothetical protein